MFRSVRDVSETRTIREVNLVRRDNVETKNGGSPEVNLRWEVPPRKDLCTNIYRRDGLCRRGDGGRGEYFREQKVL